MQTVLIVVHLIIVLALIGVVLLQRSEGGGMGLGGGGGGVSGFMTGRGQANALTRATAILAGAVLRHQPRPHHHGGLQPRAALDSRRRRPAAAGPAGSGRARAATCSSSSSASGRAARGCAGRAGRRLRRRRRSRSRMPAGAAGALRAVEIANRLDDPRAGVSGPLFLWMAIWMLIWRFANRQPFFMDRGP